MPTNLYGPYDNIKDGIQQNLNWFKSHYQTTLSKKPNLFFSIFFTQYMNIFFEDHTDHSGITVKSILVD